MVIKDLKTCLVTELIPLAISHATLGPTFYYWVYGRDLFESWTGVLG